MSQPPSSIRSRPVGSNLLREELKRDDPLREASVARFASWACFACLVAVAILYGQLGARLSTALFGLLGTLFVYYVVQRQALKRGWFHPVLQWVNTAVEVSTPAFIFVLDIFLRGPEFALSAPPLVIWGALIALSSLRSRRSIAVFAGSFAAGIYLLLYFTLAWPRLPADTLVTYSPGFVIFRAFFLLCSGAVAAALAGHLLRKAEASLRAVRERDWMGKYFLHERIGVGGMAEVFRATYSPEGGFEKEVAIKRVLPAYAADQEFVALFRREAEVCSRLAHPNVVQVYDLGRHGESYFLAMELVEGFSLEKVLAAQPERRLPVDAVIYLGLQLAAALDYVHSRTGADGQSLELIHRDVNPPNVLVSRGGEVKLTDFGVARARSAAVLTRGDWTRGKVQYMSPEQVSGEPVDARTDLFALGLTLHECLTGKVAVQGETELDQMKWIVARKVEPASKVRPDVPAELDALIASLLERDRTRRPQTGGVVLERLRSIPAGDGRAAVVAALKLVSGA